MGAPKRAGSIPMRVVTRLTGLSEATVRVWERRHAAVTPARTEGNARRYSEADVRRLALLRAAVERGHTIGEIAKRTDAELEKLARPPRATAERGAVEVVRDDYLAAVRQLDTTTGAAVLAQAAARLRPRAIALELAAPLMREIGALWHAGALSVAQEHFATQQVRALLVGVTGMLELDRGAPQIALAAPQGHQHDMGLAIGGLLAAARGVRPLHLGPDLPLVELGAAVRRTNAAVAVVAVARDVDEKERRALGAALTRLAREVELWIGAPPDHPFTRIAGARAFTDLVDFDAAVAGRFPGAAPA